MSLSAGHRPQRSYRAASIVATAIVLASFFTWRTSSALFTATTDNGPQSFTTGTVTLTDNDANGVMWSVTNLKPGDNDTKCIRVSYTGSLAASIKVYGAGLTATAGLEQWIRFTIDEGTSSSVVYPACTNFAGPTNIFDAAVSSFGTSWGTGTGNWAPSAAAAKDYRIKYTVDSAIPNNFQNANLQISITWEAQNT